MLVTDFSGGLNTRLDPSLVPANQAVKLENAQPFSGVLKSEASLGIPETPMEVGETIYNFKDTWIHGANRDYVEYRDNLYWTDGVDPKFVRGSDVENSESLNSFEAGLPRPTTRLELVDEINNPMLLDTKRDNLFRYTFYDDNNNTESPPSDTLTIEAGTTDPGVVRLSFTQGSNPRNNNINITHVILYRQVNTRYVEFERKTLLPGRRTLYFDSYAFNESATNPRRVVRMVGPRNVLVAGTRPPTVVHIGISRGSDGSFPSVTSRHIAVNYGIEIDRSTAGQANVIITRHITYGETDIFSDTTEKVVSEDPRDTLTTEDLSVEVAETTVEYVLEWYNLPSGAKSAQATTDVTVPGITFENVVSRPSTEVRYNTVNGVTDNPGTFTRETRQLYYVRPSVPNIRTDDSHARNPFITHIAIAATLSNGSTPFEFVPLANDISNNVAPTRIYYIEPGKIRDDADNATPPVTPPEAGNRILISEKNYPMPAELINLAEAYTIMFGSIGDELRFSIEDAPTSWPPENSITFPDTITGIFPIPQGILVFTAHKTFIILGTSVINFVRVPISDVEGCIHHRTCKLLKNRPLWVSETGICTYINGYVEVLSQKVLGRLPTPTHGTIKPSAVVYDERYFYNIILPEQLDENRTFLNYILVADFRDKFTFYTLKYNIPDDANMVGRIESLAVYRDNLYCSYLIPRSIIDPNRYILGLFFESGTTSTLTYRSPDFTEGSHSHLKYYDKIYLRSNGTFKVTVYIDRAKVLSDIPITGNETHDIKIPPQKQRGYSLSIKLVGTGTIYSIETMLTGRANGR